MEIQYVIDKIILYHCHLMSFNRCFPLNTHTHFCISPIKQKLGTNCIHLSALTDSLPIIVLFIQQ